MSQHSPLVSVIIPNRNYGRFLGAAIESVLAQTHDNLELIVIDNSSTDDSVAVASRYGPRVRCIVQPDQGVAAGRNRGIEESRGEFLAFLDSDDVWQPEKLERQLRLFDSPAVGMVYCGLLLIDAEGCPLETRLDGSSGQVLLDLASFNGPGVPASGSSAIVSRACLDRVGPFDTDLSYSSDWDLWRRIACHYEIRMVRETLVHYRIHGASMTRHVERLEHDMLLAFERMFNDPAAVAVHGRRRECYGNLYRMLSGSFYEAGQPVKCIRYALRSILAWPPNLLYMADRPFRRTARWFRRRASKQQPHLASMRGTDVQNRF